jgi:predicted transcriptional regulator
MKRTTVYLDELTDLELARLAKQQGRSKAELIREVLGAYVEKARKALRPVPDWVGMGNSGGKRIAERDEELLREGFAEEYERLKDMPT